MKMFLFKFHVDTGYDWNRHIAIIQASNKDEAITEFERRIKMKLHGEKYSLIIHVEIEDITPQEEAPNVIYHNIWYLSQ